MSNNKMTPDGARNLGQSLAQQGKQFDPKAFPNQQMAQQGQQAYNQQKNQGKK